MQNFFNIRFIISKNAGKSPKDYIINKIKEVYNTYPAYEIKITEHKTHAEELAKEFVEKYQENALIYVVGGDGTTSEVASVLKSENSSMGIIPSGTANDLAKQVYKTRNPEKYIKKIIENSLKPIIKKIDLININSHICINVSSIGLDSEIQNEASKYKKYGKFSYVIGVMKSLPKKQLYILSFEKIDQYGISQKKKILTHLIALGNGGYYGSGYNPFPKSSMTDGLGDFIYVDKLGLFEAVSLSMKYKKGTHIDNKKIHMGQFRKINIKSVDESDIIANFDGKIFRANEFTAEILPSSLNFAFVDIN